MSAPVRPPHLALRRLAAGPARALDRLVHLLHDRPAGTGRLLAAAAAPAALAAAPAWLHGRLGPHPAAIAPLLVDGRVPLLLAADSRVDSPALAASLDGLDGPLSVAERQLGHAFVPDPAAPPHAPPEAPVAHLIVEPAGANAPRAALLLATLAHTPGPHALPPLASRAGPLTRLARVTARFVWPLAPLPPARLAALAPGDLLLPGPLPLAGRLIAGARHRPARLESGLALRLLEEPAMTPADPPADPAAPSPDTQARLPLTATLALSAMTLEEAATLTPGRLIPIGPATTGLALTIEAGGARIGSGELVALGDDLAILVTSLAGEAAQP